MCVRFAAGVNTGMIYLVLCTEVWWRMAEQQDARTACMGWKPAVVLGMPPQIPCCSHTNLSG
jgi:hypothetical protein